MMWKAYQKANGQALKIVFFFCPITVLKWQGIFKCYLQNRHVINFYKIITYFKQKEIKFPIFFNLGEKKSKILFEWVPHAQRSFLYHMEGESRLHGKSLLIQSILCKYKQEHQKQLRHYCQTIFLVLLKIISHSMLNISNPIGNRK